MTNSHRTRESVLGRRSAASCTTSPAWSRGLIRPLSSLRRRARSTGTFFFRSIPHRPIRRPAAKPGVDRTVELEESW